MSCGCGNSSPGSGDINYTTPGPSSNQAGSPVEFAGVNLAGFPRWIWIIILLLFIQLVFNWNQK